MVVISSPPVKNAVHTECGTGCRLSGASEHDGGDATASDHCDHMATLGAVGCGASGAEVKSVNGDRLSSVNAWLEGCDRFNNGFSLGWCEAPHEAFGCMLCVSHG